MVPLQHSKYTQTFRKHQNKNNNNNKHMITKLFNYGGGEGLSPSHSPPISTHPTSSFSPQSTSMQDYNTKIEHKKDEQEIANRLGNKHHNRNNEHKY